MSGIRLFARVDQGIVAEIVPPLPLDAGWLEIMPEDGDARKLYPGYPAEMWVEITDMDPMPRPGWSANMVNGSLVLTPYVDPPLPVEQLAANARQDRDRLLSVYDAGISMALRAHRMATDDEQRAYALGKIAELDAYAELLVAVPEQAGFPTSIEWPVMPSK